MLMPLFSRQREPRHLPATLLCALVLTGCGDTSNGPAPTTQAAASNASAVTSSDAVQSSSPASQSSAIANSSAIGSTSSASGGDFVTPNGESITVTITPSAEQIAARSNATITLVFTNANGEDVSREGDLSVSSNCLTANSADITPTSSDPITYTYTPYSGCTGEDRLVFTGNWLGTSYSKDITLTVEPETLSNIQWVSTTPSQISIRGSGGVETATVRFALRSNSGANIVGETITFSIKGAAGGAGLIETSARSDENGEVTAKVRAGTAPANVIVLATHAPTGETAPSSNLVVASGVAVLGQVSIATNAFNPIGFNRLGSQVVTISVTATDRSGNPVPNGTAVNFISEEGGNITPSCALESGGCSVSFTPNGVQPADGHVQILAVIKGSEGFIDNNGNKIFDDGDAFTPEQHEIGEPYADNNNNGFYDVGEHFTDTNNDGMRNPGNNLWSGPNCQHSSLCDSSSELIDLGVQIRLVLSDWRDPTLCEIGDFAPSSFSLKPKEALSLGGLYLSDGNNNAATGSIACPLGNPLPKGTQVSFSVSTGKLLGTREWQVVDTYEPTGPYGITYEAPNETTTDVLTLSITPPSSPTLVYQWTINVAP